MVSNLADSVQWTIKIGILMAIVVCCVIVAQSPLITNYPYMGIAITIDLIFTTPLAYFFFIRNSSIPKITVAPVFILALITAWLVLPADDRMFLRMAVIYGVPAIELFGLIYLGITMCRTRRIYTSKALPGRDPMERLRIALTKEVKPAFVARAAAFEVGVFLLAFFQWLPNRSRQAFTYHRTNAPRVLLMVFLFLLVAETVVFHLLLAMWSPTAAWFATAFSIYLAIQVFAHLKAIGFRPISITDSELLFRCGILGDATIDLDSIRNAEIIDQAPDDAPGLVTITPLGLMSQPNVRMDLDGEMTFCGLYGIERRASSFAFFVDEPERLIEVLRSRL